MPARLISDIEAISLADHEASATIPSYRSLSIIPPEKVIAALGRRVFVAGPAAESVDYAHRTTAEYLGAAWLAAMVRNGMPFNRLQALMGIDGHPAPELRGLHAWLAVYLDFPEHVDRLIDTDPYGVLTYGDAASLAKSSCAHLVKALGKLSQTDPWFRSGNWQSPAIGALSRADMVDEFRAVLRSNSAGFAVRSIVVEAAAIGAPMPALKSDLVNVLLRPQSPYAERLYALIALLRIGREGEVAAEAAFHQLGTDVGALRLRTEMIHRMYGRPFGPTDITALLRDTASSDETDSSILYVLSKHIPVNDIAPVLDGLEPARPAAGGSWRNGWEVARFIDRLLTRAWRDVADIEPTSALNWLRLRNSYSGGHSGGRTDDLRAAVRERPALLRAVTDHFFEMFVPDKDRWSRLARFREITFYQVKPEEMLAHMTVHMGRVPAGSEKELFLYEAAFAMTYSMDGQPAATAFETLYGLADNRADLRMLRDASVSCAIPDGLLNRPPRDDDEGQDAETQRREFEKAADAVRSGSHLGWLTWAAQVYFGLFADSDEAAHPRERLVAALGEANTQTALAGFLAALSRSDFPQLADVAQAAVQHRRHNWWLVMSAGLMERWEATPSLAGLSDEFLMAALAFSLTNPVFEQVHGSSREIVPGWKTAAMQERPELARDAYVAVARAKLTNGDQMADGLRELMVEETFKPSRRETVLGFLGDFPNADPYRLDELFDGVFATPAAHHEFLDLADRVLTGAASVDQRQQDMWLAAAYLLSPNRYEAQLEATATLRPAITFDLRDHTGYGYGYNAHGSRHPGTLPLPQLEFLARLTGTLYPETPFPAGVSTGDRILGTRRNIAEN